MLMVHTSNGNDLELFKSLLQKTRADLQNKANSDPQHFLGRTAPDFENDVFNAFKQKAQNTIFSNTELISGQSFPDIVAYINEEKAYGIEVKKVQKATWRTLGGSIFESSRVKNVESIYLMFGKLAAPVDFKYGKYEDCISDVLVTHSPRYELNMELDSNNNFFNKIDIDYDKLRQSENPFLPIKKYFRSQLKEGEDLWYLDNDEEGRNLIIRLWSNLNQEDRKKYKTMAFAYFPEILSNGNRKYSRLATWLVSRFAIVNTSLRDEFSAGGRENIDGTEFPKVTKYLIDSYVEIKKHILEMSDDDISFYWGAEEEGNRIDEWKKLAFKYLNDILDPKQLEIIKTKLS